MAPVRTPSGSQIQIPKRKPASLLVQGRDVVLALLFDRAYFLHLTGLLLLGELALGLLIIRYIPCEVPSRSIEAELILYRYQNRLGCLHAACRVLS